MSRDSNHLGTDYTQGDLGVFSKNQDSCILQALDNKDNTNGKLAPVEVQPTLLSSNNQVLGCTSIGGNNLDSTLLKMYLKNLALKILEEEYEKCRNSCTHLHQSFNTPTRD